MQNQPPALLAPHLLAADELEHELWKVATADPVLAASLRRDHPFFVFELLTLSESIAFRVGVRSLPARVSGAAFCYDLQRQMPDKAEEKRFRAGLMSALRALLFWEIGAGLIDRRNSLELIAYGQIQWASVRRFIQFCLFHLPLIANLTDEPGQVVVYFTPLASEQLASAPQFAPFSLSFSKADLSKRYAGVSDDWLTVSTVALRDHLMVWLSRALVEMVTPEQAELQRQHGPRAKENVQAAAAMLRGQIAADPVGSQRAHGRLSAKLIESLRIPQ